MKNSFISRLMLCIRFYNLQTLWECQFICLVLTVYWWKPLLFCKGYHHTNNTMPSEWPQSVERRSTQKPTYSRRKWRKFTSQSFPKSNFILVKHAFLFTSDVKEVTKVTQQNFGPSWRNGETTTTATTKKLSEFWLKKKNIF